MEAVSDRMEDNRASPDGLQLLHNQRMRQEFLGLCANGNLECRDARMLLPLPVPVCAACLDLQTLQGVVVVAQRIDQLSCGELLQQAHSQQLAEKRPRLADTNISRICLSFLPELEAICDQAVQGTSREVLCANLLLYRLDQELRNLRRAQLVPAQSRFAALDDDLANVVGVVVYGNAV